MQAGLDSPWFAEEDPEMMTITVGIEGVRTVEYDIPISMLEQEFSDDEARRGFIMEQIESIGRGLSVEWKENQ